MTNEFCNTTASVAIWAGESRELVRGQDRWLLERMIPLVRQQSLTLDLRSVERIDAAGIAALISLYRAASEAGHAFTVCNASARLAEILKLVGLDRILLSHDAVRPSHPEFCLERPAA
jgi:anti-anti-sigma factor